MKRKRLRNGPYDLTRLRRFKARWVSRVFQDHELSYSARMLAYFLADFCTLEDSLDEYKETGKVFVWPSQQTLKEKTAMNKETISLGVTRLIARGHLECVRRGNQFKGSNKYRLRLKKAESA